MTGAAPIRAGFIPLIDCAPLIAAVRAGFAETEGLRVDLVRETSWASLRDRIAVRHLDAAHMLAPMPIAASLGLTPLPVALIAPVSLGFGGNTVTVSVALSNALDDAGATQDLSAKSAADAFARVVAQRRQRGEPCLVLAIVHPHSAHYYQLAYWLAAAGLDPEADVDITVVPPPLMPDALAGGQIDGFCVGEPWGSVAAMAGTGRILTTSAHIWRSGPEKVLGVRRTWAEEQPDRLEGLVRAVVRAARWCDDPANRTDLARILASPEILNQPEAVVARSLARRSPGPRGAELTADGFLTFAAAGASEPRIAHAAWLYAQMVRWGQTRFASADLATALGTFRPDMVLRAGGPEAATAKAGPAALLDGFFDGEVFDAGDIEGYLARTRMRTAAEPSQAGE